MPSRLTEYFESVLSSAPNASATGRSTGFGFGGLRYSKDVIAVHKNAFETFNGLPIGDGTIAERIEILRQAADAAAAESATLGIRLVGTPDIINFIENLVLLLVLS